MSSLLDSSSSTYRDDADPTSAIDRVRDAIRVLEAIADDRTLLSDLTAEERLRLLVASGRVSRPDALQRRQIVKASKRERKLARTQEAEAVLQTSGIRTRRLLARDVVREASRAAARGEEIGPRVFAPAPFEPEAPETMMIDDRDAELRQLPAVVAQSNGEVHNCYVCKADYVELHPFYDQLCPPCAALNFAKRTETADLTGRVALLTGGRVKIGYQAGLKLLRAGASLIVTTRFPRDSAARYAAEPDFAQWSHRLEVFGLDLRHTPSVEAFCAHLLATRDRLDFIVNNACQTVRRPPDFYRHLMADEMAAAHSLPAHARAVLGAYEGLRGEALIGAGGVSAPGEVEPALTPVGLTHAAALSQVALLPDEHAADAARATLFPEGLLDEDAQQVDLRERNSWRLQLDEVSSVELLEVQLVNAIAPYVLNARLRPLMQRTPGREKHIVNVSAMEGQFYRRFKTTRHPHTNMAKAALNMMTRTSAADYLCDGIHMNAVDTGWVTDEDPAAIAARKTAEHRFHPPLDIVDGAARIVDPIIAGINTGEHVWGQFLKDYGPTDW